MIIMIIIIRIIIRLVDSSYQADSLHRVSNHLQLGPLKRSDLNSIFTCQVFIFDIDDDHVDDDSVEPPTAGPLSRDLF